MYAIRSYYDVLKDTKYIAFDDVSGSYYDDATVSYNLTKAKKDLKESDYYALLYIPHTAIQSVITSYSIHYTKLYELSNVVDRR